MKKWLLLLVMGAMVQWGFAQDKEGMYAKIITSKGEILVSLEFEKMPLTVANFVGLAEGSIPNKWHAEQGEGYYDGLTFHRVVDGKIIQGGCKSGDGLSDPGYYFKTESDKSKTLKHDAAGVLSMANAGKKYNGSQFFITLKEFPDWDGKYGVFGHVESGMDVVQKIKQGDMIKRVEIIRKGQAAKDFDAKATFDALK